MEKMKYCNRWLAMALCVALLLCLTPFQVSAASDDALCYYNGSNANAQDYARYASPMNSYLTALSNGTLMRVQANATADKYVIVYYDAGYQPIRSLTVPAELPIFGGFYASGTHYYIVSGQTNTGELADVECFRITQYDLQWNRLASTGLYDCNTTVPFDASSVRFAMSGKYLLIRTGHEMYESDDGKNHQANVTIQLDTEAMTITDSYTKVMNNGYGYISHSFNQFIQIEDNKIVAVEHGDAHPRSIVLLQYRTDVSTGSFTPDYYTKCAVTDLWTFPGAIGDNVTGASVGGFEISSTSYLTAFNSVIQDENFASRTTRNIYIASMDKQTSEVTVKQITTFSEGSAATATPHLVKLSDDAFILLWYRAGSVYYAKLDAEGDVVGQIYSITGASLSDCVPQIYNGKLVWYVWENKHVTFYDIDLANIASAKKTVLNNEHTGTIIYPTSAGGTCTIDCDSCSYSGSFETSSYLYIYWNTERYGSYSTLMPTTVFDVGQRLYMWPHFSTTDFEHNSITVNVSDPDGISYTVIEHRGDSIMGYLEFNKLGTYTVTVTYDYNPNLTQSYSIEVTHTDTDSNGICDGCGASTAVPALSVYGKTLALEDIVQVSYYFTLENIADSDIAASGLQVWNEADYAASADPTYTVEGLTKNGSYYNALSQGIPAKNMGDTIFARGYVTLTDGTTVYSDVIEYSALTYARNQYNKTTEAAVKLKPLLVALMNYGAAAQVHFDYNTGNLMNSFLTAEEQAASWDDGFVNVSAKDTAGKYSLQTENSSAVIAKINKSVSLEGALAVNLYATLGITDVQEIAVLYWDAETYASAEALTEENAVKLPTVKNGNYRVASIEGVAAKRMSGDCYACVYVVDAEGNTHYSELVCYNAHNYAANQIAKDQDADLIALCKAIVIYGNAAESYFAD